MREMNARTGASNLRLEGRRRNALAWRSLGEGHTHTSLSQNPPTHFTQTMTIKLLIS
jgi:hypothetical protein